MNIMKESDRAYSEREGEIRVYPLHIFNGIICYNNYSFFSKYNLEMK